MRKSHFNAVFGVVGAHNQQVFACSNDEKYRPKEQSPISMALTNKNYFGISLKFCN
jgi:hypothetical protein